jgi:radical SAM protein with 4Fe4S-binding SPASM domain
LLFAAVGGKEMIENIIIISVLVLIIGAVSFYIYKAKKKGQKCIGCPYSKNCKGNCK